MRDLTETIGGTVTHVSVFEATNLTADMAERIEDLEERLEDRSRDLHDAEDHAVEPWERCEDGRCRDDRQLLREARTPEYPDTEHPDPIYKR